ncbi:MAG TPA: PLDc N-terminal domain-containing protein [Rhizomicrobium sp.]|jgi:hypothetical protein|nr:PLDc N-terminal domain-containing protein [Rhizomicrobium sp.]
MSYFYIITLLVQLGCAAHVIRTDRPWIWILPIMFVPWLGCIAYMLFGVLPDAVRGHAPVRRIFDDAAGLADSGATYSRKKRDVETIGSAQSKRVFAEECIKRGRYQEAVDLYASAIGGAHSEDPALLHGLARARLLAGDASGAQTAFESLKSVSPADFTVDARLDYARALALQGKDEAATAEYQSLIPVYPGEEARCRYALLLQDMGDRAGAEKLFREIVDAMRDAPGYYRRRQREWVNIAKQNLRG